MVLDDLIGTGHIEVPKDTAYKLFRDGQTVYHCHMDNLRVEACMGLAPGEWERGNTREHRYYIQDVSAPLINPVLLAEYKKLRRGLLKSVVINKQEVRKMLMRVSVESRKGLT